MTAPRRWAALPGWKRARPFVLLALPLLVYAIPALAGYAWSALDPRSPQVTGADGYHGRLPDAATAVEWYGTGVVAVPFQARLRQCVRRGDLPLWNPYQGLGQPFAAQGEGCPYFPLSVLRSLLPYSLSNVVTLAAYYLSCAFFFLFLRELGLSERAALLAGMAWGLSGALSLHVARPNLAEQTAMIPVLFWAAARAMRARTPSWYAACAAVSGLHVLAGFIQIALTPLLVIVPFCGLYTRWRSRGHRDWLRDFGLVTAALLLGNGLGAFHLLPMAEAMRALHNKNVEHLSFLAIPYANLLGFFFPYLFGQLFQNWVPGSYPRVLDWNNLYAYAGTLALLLNVLGWWWTAGAHPRRRMLFCFFSLCGLVLLLRYVSCPLVAGVNYLPVVGRQSPKHANGTAVFCFLAAAAFAAQYVRARLGQAARRRVAVVFALAASAVLTQVAQQGGFARLDRRLALAHVSVSLLVSGTLLAALLLARRWGRLGERAAFRLLLAASVAELALYVPLGNRGLPLLAGRVGLFALVVLGGLLLALGRWRAAGGLLALTAAGFAALVAAPRAGLPARFNVDTPPPYLRLLRAAAGQQYRAFGITPDYSSIAGVQDVGCVGPFAPPEYVRFVELIASAAMAEFYRAGTSFWLARDPYNSTAAEFSFVDYLRSKPVLDWVGVRYLVLDRAHFGPGGRRTDHLLLLSPACPGVRVAYQDARVLVLESLAARPKAAFSPAVAVCPSQEAILRELRGNPAAILAAPRVERAALSGQPPPQGPAPGPAEVPLVPDAYRPNFVRVTVDAPGPGIVVLKDVYAPGWRARLNGKETDVLRVNGLVRGVLIPQAGHAVVEFVYRPRSFVRGLVLAALTFLLLTAVVVSSRLRPTPRRVPRWALAVGVLLLGVLAAYSVEAYFGVPVLRGLPV
jgi:hypothetical protein